MTLSLFIALMGLMLVGFLAYHVWLVAVNSTTYEQLKLGRQLKALHEADDGNDLADGVPQEDQPQEAEEPRRSPYNPAKGLCERVVGCCKAWMRPTWCSPYDRGLRNNIGESLWPERMIALHRSAAADTRKQQ